jgi:hypothetical protein
MEYCEKTEVSPFSYPPDIQHQVDVLGPFNKNLSTWRDFYFIGSSYFILYDILFSMKQIVGSLLYLATLLSLSVFVFDPTHLYYELPWLDIPMHIMGGFGVASLFIAVQLYHKKKIHLAHLLVFYLIIAISWEMYEYVKDVIHISPWNGWSDTISDVINGALGSLSAFFIFKK